jgi:hypothetical protein
MYYYGVRYKDGFGPESLGNPYFSSSKYVKKHIEKYGNPDIIQVRKIFDTKIAAKKWESKVLRRIDAAHNPKWLNKSNNNSFRNAVMDTDVRALISEKRKGQFKGYKSYTNGILEIKLPPNSEIPEGYWRGIRTTDKREAHKKRMREPNYRSKENRLAAGKKISAKTKGKPKPEGHGANVSAATKGKPKPWNTGENNPSKSVSARTKISEKKTGCRFFNFEDHEIFVRPENAPEGYVLGRKKTNCGRTWFSLGEHMIFVRPENAPEEYVKCKKPNANLNLGKSWFYLGFLECLVKPENAPEGYVKGRAPFKTKTI